MRKYRGLNKKWKTWAYGFYCCIEDKHYIIERDVEFTDVEIPCPVHGINGFAEVIPETVGQFTGDIMHGKDIFAGDILEYWFGAPWNPEEPIRVIGEVIWQNSGWWFHCAGEYDGHLADVGEGKIIGNTTENPELMEKQ